MPPNDLFSNIPISHIAISMIVIFPHSTRPPISILQPYDLFYPLLHPQLYNQLRDLVSPFTNPTNSSRHHFTLAFTTVQHPLSTIPSHSLVSQEVVSAVSTCFISPSSFLFSIHLSLFIHDSISIKYSISYIVLPIFY